MWRNASWGSNYQLLTIDNRRSTIEKTNNDLPGSFAARIRGPSIYIQSSAMVDGPSSMVYRPWSIV